MLTTVVLVSVLFGSSVDINNLSFQELEKKKKGMKKLSSQTKLNSSVKFGNDAG